MISLFLKVPPGDWDTVIAEIWDVGTSGITEEPDGIRAFFEDAITAEDLAERYASFSPVLRTETDQDWDEVSRAQWEPITVGNRFFLVPEWRDDPAPEGRIRLTTYPGMACGTGLHPATQLCLMAMEDHLQEGAKVIDVGTGSGILAEAAYLLGAEVVVACDIDYPSVEIAKRNLAHRDLGVRLFQGSLRSLRSSTFQTIIANLNRQSIIHLSADFRRVLCSNALLIVAGFRTSELREVTEALVSTIIAQYDKDDWSLLVLRPI